ncbi:hypothetical protein [Chitinophaga nivalis]|uniref:DUF4369 domain-containing protein n=1 Tax=Chitinophaga nivalis TaxID=2991709 RepID=A0ABT3IMM2_9BACT|nr:hypothetical protein [Chitinophaga nivalis]MCW3465334.1 hypothetical protein [Chitinophaga nivalis]MCW3484974.1 hypothetical protein [Chitinophaga nivalis]
MPLPVTLFKKCRRKISLALLSFHFLLILLVSISSTIRGYTTLYHHPKGKEPLLTVARYCHVLTTTPGILQYISVSGIDAGYGYFAPNVASGYVVHFVLKDKNRQPLYDTYFPPFKNAESMIRYVALMGCFQDKLPALQQENTCQSLYIRYLNTLIKSMGQSILARYQHIPADHLIATLYLYEYPSLKDYIAEKTTPRLIALENIPVAAAPRPFSVPAVNR